MLLVRVVTAYAVQGSLRSSINHSHPDPASNQTVVPAGPSFVGPQSITSSSPDDMSTQSLSGIGTITTPAPFLALSMCPETSAQRCAAQESFPSTRSEVSTIVGVLLRMTKVSQGKGLREFMTYFASADLFKLPGNHLQSSTRRNPNPIGRVMYGL
ncbi:hypothetical protein HO173_003305 [Letharia columbiana]|uniref:Uncharacterized protein n=1 Tax=Letharia columbiana TaxID=112416 RepID=A0A8H6L7X0_9LECA|nr:uncharacterized protein HO173_003305 [Letharia columbiana]KAF6238798.1 hypothetical protein HO173_003305 [Letharia columbiana]